jgi:hypothetical protein
MTRKKVLVLKNDRGGDLLNSITCISSLLTDKNDTTIFLSDFNIGFGFLFKNAKINKINYNLNLLDKLKIFIYILYNKFDEIYILTPKNYYYYLPFFFRKINFYAITVDGVKRKRPSDYLKRFLSSYVIIDRKKINIKSSSELQQDLISKKYTIDKSLININRPKLDSFIKKNIPEKFIFVQYKESFYNKINLSERNFLVLLDSLALNNEHIIFSSDIEFNQSNIFFFNNLRVFDCKNKILKNLDDDRNITYLHNIDSENLFAIIEKSHKIISPHGLVTHMCKFYNKKSINLFNFIIRNNKDLLHQKIAFSEWYKNMNIKFLFLNSNVDRTIKKINKNL